MFNVIYSLPLTDKYETENQKSDTKRRAVLDGAGTFLGQVHPPLQNIPKVMYGHDNAGADQTDVPSSTSFVRFEEFAKNLWPHTLSKFFSWALSELKWQSFSMLAGFSMLADMLTKQTAAPQK